MSDLPEMSDAEIIDRMDKYKLPGNICRKFPDRVSMNSILRTAQINKGSYNRFRNGKLQFKKETRQRLIRAITMAETGMLRRENGKEAIGDATKPMPARMTIKLTNGFPKLESKQVNTPVGTMPKFLKAFMGVFEKKGI